jgi:uncharacterized protein YPO0396
MMLILRRFRLVNWHYFTDATVEMGPATLLGGDNASGKSTIIDAIQYGLVAQVGKIHFNAAASDRRTARSLESYCRCKVGADSLDYLRGDCISHVILEFGDGERAFCAGIMVEAFTEGDAREHEWLLEGGTLGDVKVDDGARLLEPRIFRDAVKQQGGILCATKREYNSRLTHLLGVHRRGADFNPYLEAVVRSVSFTPFTSVHDFVCNYILEEHDVDVGAMKENLQNYRAAEREAFVVEKKIQRLEEIAALTTAVAQAARQILRQEYLGIRLRVDQQADLVAGTRREAEQTSTGLANAEDALSLEQQRKDRLDALRQELQFSLAKDEQHRLYERLRRDRADLERRITEEATRMQRRASLVDQCRALLGRPLCDDLAAESEALSREQEAATRDVVKASLEIEGEKAELAALYAEDKDLAAGILRHPEPAMDLKDAVEKAGIPAAIFADLLEVTDASWHDAVEGWLNTQRFNVLVPEADFQRALEIYHDLPAKTAGVGVPNLAAIHDEEVHPGSLAEVIEARTPAARRYAAFLMGDVIRSDIATLKLHERSITADCMRYSSHTATRIREDVYRRWYIGREARQRRLQEVREGIERHGRAIETLLAARREAQAKIEIVSRVLRQLPVIEDLASADERLKIARLQAEELDGQLASVDTSSFEALRTQIAAYADSIRVAEKAVGDLRERIGSMRSRLELLGSRLQGEEAECERRQAELAGFLAVHQPDEADLTAYYEDRMRAERRQTDGRIEIGDMIRRYESSHAGLRTRLEKARTDLRAAKQRYNHDENEILGLEDDESLDYLQRLTRYRETELPEYRDRISRAREEAERQFREHFVTRLNEYLQEAEESFKEINHILEEIRFGKDQYRFSIARNPEKQRLLSAISSAAEIRDLEGPLFSTLKSDEERESIERLFTDVLTHELDDPAVRELCDYRQYFVYDIRIRHTDSLDEKTGKALESLLSRVLREKSGGETQTPYYVAIAASFFRFYKDAPGAIRLVLFDEAFSKMDDERIGTMIDFFRKLAMQVVTAVPTEKIESIAPHMDRTNLVVRRNTRAFVRDYAILEREVPKREATP